VLLSVCVILMAASLTVAGSLGGSRGNLGPKDTSSASALQVDVSTQVSTSILRYLQLNEGIRGYTQIACRERYLKCSASGREPGLPEYNVGVID
jgi:hypothetical protein